MVGLCVALGACGEKFVSHADVDGNGGTSGAGSGGDHARGTAGTGEGGHDDSAGAGGDAGDGGAGSDVGGSGGVPALGGAGGLLGVAGLALGGSSGTAGSGGALIDPTLPQVGLLLWLRADRGVTEKDGFVVTWQDQSENKLHASQLSMNTRPAYLPMGFNGRPTLEFDGEGQFLKFGDGFGDFSKGLSALIVAKPTKSDCASMLEFSNGSEVQDIAFGMWQDKWAYEVETDLNHTGQVEHSAFSLYAVNHRPAGGGSADLRINGSTLQSVDMRVPVLPDSGVRSNNFVGHTLYAEGCEYFRGQISEIILYSRALTNAEVTAIEKYLEQHWSLGTQDVPVPTP